MKRNSAMAMIGIAAAAVAGGSMPPTQASGRETAAEVASPSPPHVDLVASPASALRLGMTASDVDRIMGHASKSTRYVKGQAEMQRLEFLIGPIPARVTLADGRVSGVALDVFRVDKGELPAFSRRAVPGMSSAGVRQALGLPTYQRRLVRFGVELQQMVFRRAGEPDVSVLLVDDRVIARTLGQNVPTDVFHVTLPSPDKATNDHAGEDIRVGMKASEVPAISGREWLRVDYTFNRQPASHVIYQRPVEGSFTDFTIVGGVVTEFSDLGRMTEDYQGL